MDEEEFARAFSLHTHFKPNPFHPLVWINGSPDIGKNVYIGGLSEINANGAHVFIGDNCDIASFVSINCADSHRKSIGISAEVDRRDITLEESVFVGSHVVIKGGAHIGHHSVVAAGTIVEGRRIPPYSLVIGNPMVVKEAYYLPTQNPEVVPHNRPTLGFEEEKASIDVIRSGWVAQGKEVRAFEDEFCAYLGLPAGHAVAVSNGTSALYLALEVLSAEGKRTALPGYVCASVMHACRFARANPILIDNAVDSPNLDLDAVRAANAQIAVVPHMYGIPVDLSGMMGLKLIEDCAQSIGASVKGVPVGLQADVGIFSFYATKLMTSGGQGGMLVSKDTALVAAARDFREFDQRTDRKLRFNIQMTDLQAAIGRQQLKKLPAFLQRRKELFDVYRSAGLPLLQAGVGLQQTHYRAVLRTNRAAQVVAALESARVRAIVPLEDWELLGPPASLPRAAALCQSTISLPLYPSLTDANARRIAEVVLQCA
jgi:perosamine synthetase